MTKNENIEEPSGDSQLSAAELVAVLKQMEHDSKEKICTKEHDEKNETMPELMLEHQPYEPNSEPTAEPISENLSENSNSSTQASKKIKRPTHHLVDEDKLNCHLCVPDHTFESKSKYEKHVRSHKHKHMISVYNTNEKCKTCNSVQYHNANPCKIEQCIPCYESNYPIWYDQLIKKEQVDYMEAITNDMIKEKENENKILEKKIKEFPVLEELLKGVVDGFMADDEMDEAT